MFAPAGGGSDADDFASPANSSLTGSPGSPKHPMEDTSIISGNPILLEETPETVSNYVTTATSLREESDASNVMTQQPSKPECLSNVRPLASGLSPQTAARVEAHPAASQATPPLDHRQATYQSEDESSPQVAQSTLRKTKQSFVVEDDSSRAVSNLWAHESKVCSSPFLSLLHLSNQHASALLDSLFIYNATNPNDISFSVFTFLDPQAIGISNQVVGQDQV